MAIDLKYKFLCVILILWLFFISANSLKDAKSSSADSEMMVRSISSVVSGIYNGNPPSNIISIFDDSFESKLRNYAHFTEFFILGIFLTLVFSKSGLSIRKIFLILIICIFIALGDETLQLFSKGRDFQISDVIKDVTGAVLGSLLIFFRKELSYRLSKR